jgi:hypothetical protein
MECSVPFVCSLTQDQVNAVGLAWDVISNLAESACNSLDGDSRRDLLMAISELQHAFPAGHPISHFPT